MCIFRDGNKELITLHVVSGLTDTLLDPYSYPLILKHADTCTQSPPLSSLKRVK